MNGNIENSIVQGMKEALTMVLGDIRGDIRKEAEFYIYYISKEEFRDKFHVGNETIDNLVRDGHISKSKFGRKYFYDVREINKYLDSKKEFC